MLSINVTPLQLAPNGYSILSALYIIYAQLVFPQPIPLEVNYIYTLKKIPDGGASFYYLSVWSLGKLNLIVNTSSNAGSWKESFFWVQQSDVSIKSFKKAGGKLVLLV